MRGEGPTLYSDHGLLSGYVSDMFSSLGNNSGLVLVDPSHWQDNIIRVWLRVRDVCKVTFGIILPYESNHVCHPHMLSSMAAVGTRPITLTLY